MKQIHKRVQNKVNQRGCQDNNLNGGIKMKKASSIIGNFMVFAFFASYLAAHIWTAIVLFKAVKLWAFLVILCVPVLGDLMGIYVLFKIGFYVPFILYGISVIVSIICGVISK